MVQNSSNIYKNIFAISILNYIFGKIFKNNTNKLLLYVRLQKNHEISSIYDLSIDMEAVFSFHIE